MSPGLSRESGLTALEVIVMGFVMSVLMLMTTQSIASLSSTRGEHRQHANIGNVADRVARILEQDVGYAARVFANNAADLAYLTGLEPGPALLAAGAKLPTLTSRGYFDEDPPSQPAETGNLILVGVRGERLSVPLDSPPVEYHVQILNLVVYSVMRHATGDADLWRWSSDPLVSYWDVEQIANPEEKARVLSKLYEGGVRYAWDPTQPRATGLFDVRQGGGMTPLPATTPLRGKEDAGGSYPFAKRRMRIAANGSLHGVQIPKFAKPAGTFPGGFEVKVDGTSSGKLVLFRLVIESTMHHKRQVFSEIHRLVSTDG